MNTYIEDAFNSSIVDNNKINEFTIKAIDILDDYKSKNEFLYYDHFKDVYKKIKDVYDDLTVSEADSFVSTFNDYYANLTINIKSLDKTFEDFHSLITEYTN